MKRCLIERGRFVAPCEFDTQEQLDRFLELGKKECDKKNLENEELAEHRNLPEDCYPRCWFGYRENFDKTESEQIWDKLDKLGETPFSVDETTVYPESVLKNASTDFTDKRARWAASKAGNSSDARTMRRLLHRAEQVRKDFPKVNSDELSDLDKRNKFIYDCAQDEKLSWGDIAKKVEEKFKEYLTNKATAQAARDYRKKYGLSPVPDRKRRGRPTGSTPKSQDE
jgi:hypothetical protein